jgi:hypothetical protein
MTNDDDDHTRSDDSLTFDAGDHASGMEVHHPSARPTTKTQTWWLSFVDSDRPTGDQFLGVAVVDVTEADAAAGHRAARQRRAEFGHSEPVEPWIDWMTAAILKTHRTGCNPGGEVGAVRIDEAPEYPTKGATLPRNTLLSKAELAARGCL